MYVQWGLDRKLGSPVSHIRRCAHSDSTAVLGGSLIVEMPTSLSGVCGIIIRCASY